VEANSINPEVIPHDYSCGLVFRTFETTLIHEHTSWLGRNGIFYDNDRSDILGRYFTEPNACLERYLVFGWPEIKPGARWNHRERTVEVFADDLFLCPNCGEFSMKELWLDSPDILGLAIEGEQIARWPRETKVTPECAQSIREFCQSRLNTDEFSLKSCEKKIQCRQFRAGALDRARHKWGWKDKQGEQDRLDEAAEREKRIEQLLLNEGFVYLIQLDEFFKIGIAKDVQKRLSSIKVSTPHSVELIKSWRCRNPLTLEKRMHAQFKQYKVQGEWFRLPEDAVNFLLAIQDLRKEFAPDEQLE
jgi:hypothetical protein